MIPLAWIAGMVGCATGVPPAVSAAASPTASVGCGSTCSMPDAAAPTGLSDDEIADLLVEVAAVDVGVAALPVETLLFHAGDTASYLSRHGPGPLPPAHADWIAAELSRDRVAIDLRLVDGEGRILGQRRDVIRLWDKHHLVLDETGSLGRLDVSGKVKRVGVDHLWARF